MPPFPRQLILSIAFAFSVTAMASSDDPPPLLGSYRSDTTSPRVFQTGADLKDMATRINKARSFSSQRFAKLAMQVSVDLKPGTDWSATYSGCDLDVYLHAFSYEFTDGYVDEQRLSAQIKVATNIRQSGTPPSGAAIVAARLALYSSLVRAGAHAPSDAPSAQSAEGLAKTILIAWAEHGFRDGKGQFLTSSSQFCDGQKKFNRMEQSNVGLQVARGVAYSVEAQDLLDGLGLISDDDRNRLNRFHAAMYDLIRSASDIRAEMPEFNKPTAICDRFSNHVGVHLLGMIAVARLLNDRGRLEGAVHGGGTLSVDIPWTVYVSHAIYRAGDQPLGCARNTGGERASSKPYFQTGTVASGEINDRYRNANPGQAIGYPMFALRTMYVTANVLDRAGFNAFDYRGSSGQSIQQATDYYACYGATPGFKKTVSADNAAACADHEQYVGATVSEVETVVLPGARHYSGDRVIKAIEPAAKALTWSEPVDPLLFGQWND